MSDGQIKMGDGSWVNPPGVDEVTYVPDREPIAGALIACTVLVCITAVIVALLLR